MKVIAMEHYSHIGHHTTPEGTDGFLLGQRIVPIREEPGKVFARTLRYGEHDDGRRCHERPGDDLVVEELVMELDYIDEWEGQGVDGYVPLTPVLFTWMSFGTSHPEEKRRYLFAAARRLGSGRHRLALALGRGPGRKGRRGVERTLRLGKGPSRGTIGPLSALARIEYSADTIAYR
jgi:hypothetical protein